MTATLKTIGVTLGRIKAMTKFNVPARVVIS